MKDLRAAVLTTLLFTVLCGGIYPAAVTLVAAGLFPRQAGGSLVRDAGGRLVGSTLIGQPFDEPGYFWPRPSATGPFPYNPGGSAGSNLGPTNPALLAAVAGRAHALRAAGIPAPVPADLVLASASGLDPHVSPAAALAQLPRVAAARGLSEEELRRLVAARTAPRQLGFLGEPRVNVLELNLALDGAPGGE